MDHDTEQGKAFLTQINTLNSQVEELTLQLLKEKSSSKETKVLLYQYNI